MKHTAIVLSLGIAVLGLSFASSPAGADVPDPMKIAAAKTPADHEAIAKAYEKEAASLEKMSDMHKNLGDTYAQPGGQAMAGGTGQTLQECRV